MKSLRAISIISILLVAALDLASAQTWTPLTHQPAFAAGTALLLTDGRVLVHNTEFRAWWTLTPDLTGSYLNGTWKRAGALPAGYGPLYYSSAVLPDGRVVIMGGEYNLGKEVWTTLGAI